MEPFIRRRECFGIMLLATLATSSFFQPRTASAESPTTQYESAATQHLAVIGDVRTSGLRPPPIFFQVATQLEKDRPEVVLSVGDLINAHQGANPEAQWTALTNAVQQIGAQQFYPCLGNHDTRGSLGALDDFRAAFSLPGNAPGSLKGIAYSVDVGRVHLVCVSTEYPGAEHSLGYEQLDWLASDLAQSSAPYVLVFGHDPAFAVGPHLGESLDSDPEQRDRFWNILRDAHVTAYFAGHEHLYHREDYQGLTQIILGSSGSDIDRGFGGEFVGYATIDVSDSNLQVQVLDSQGLQRDAFSELPRDVGTAAGQHAREGS